MLCCNQRPGVAYYVLVMHCVLNHYHFFSSSHTINLLSNLPVQCLDVLIDVPVQGGMETYGGKNMDIVQILLDFMEKRMDKVLPFR